jgi:hypothetical protein
MSKPLTAEQVAAFERWLREQERGFLAPCGPDVGERIGILRVGVSIGYIGAREELRRIMEAGNE